MVVGVALMHMLKYFIFVTKHSVSKKIVFFRVEIIYELLIFAADINCAHSNTFVHEKLVCYNDMVMCVRMWVGQLIIYDAHSQKKFKITIINGSG